MSRALKWAGVCILLLVAAGLVAPFIHVDAYREQIRNGLQRSLQRKVDIYGNTRLNLFRGPGFSVEKVVIHDDPSISAEPLASVPELQATVSLSSLWTGRLEFATVRFVEPSLNLARAAEGAWNVVPLVQAAASAGTGRVPGIIVAGGRINFKIDDVKSTFYLTSADLSVTPGRDGFEILFSCAPARTDRSATGYGLFSGRGRITSSRIDLDVELEESPIEELLTFARGRALGLHGIVSSRAHVSGPLTAPEVKGRLELKDVHRWDLIDSGAGGWAINYRGRADLAGQRVELTADARDNEGTPVALRLFVSRLLTSPEWRAEAGVEGLPASKLLDFARHMGTPLPDGLSVQGKVAGTIAYSGAAGMQGEVRIENADLQMAGGPQFAIPHASLMFSGDEVHLLPAVLAGKGNAAQLQATYAPFRQRLTAQLTGRGLRIADLQRGSARLLAGIDVPVMRRFRGGTWSGFVRYSGNGPSEPDRWTAGLLVRGTATTIPGVAEPVHLHTANIDIDGDKLKVRRMRAEVGGLEVLGSYSFEPADPRPHRFDLSLPAADVATMERILAPTFQRSASFLARAFRLRSVAPAWLQAWRAEGQLRIGMLTAGDLEFRGVRTRVMWSGTDLEFTDLRGRYDGALFAGILETALNGPQPAYRISGKLTNLPWKQGRVDLAGELKTFGTGPDVLLNLRADGHFEARSVAFGPEVAFGNASGAFAFTGTRTGPAIRLTSLEAAVGSERFNGEGALQADGRLLVDLESPNRWLRVHGPMAALKTEFTTERTAVR